MMQRYVALRANSLSILFQLVSGLMWLLQARPHLYLVSTSARSRRLVLIIYTKEPFGSTNIFFNR